MRGCPCDPVAWYLEGWVMGDGMENRKGRREKMEERRESK